MIERINKFDKHLASIEQKINELHKNQEYIWSRLDRIQYANEFEDSVADTILEALINLPEEEGIYRFYSAQGTDSDTLDELMKQEQGISLMQDFLDVLQELKVGRERRLASKREFHKQLDMMTVLGESLKDQMADIANTL